MPSGQQTRTGPRGMLFFEVPYNLSGGTGLHGHLRPERCAGVAFMERQFFGRLSASILLFNRDGGVMFKIFVGRDDKRELLADQLAKFRALADRLCK